eukprot:5360-Heterococcus_DN1.PRE.2
MESIQTGQATLESLEWLRYAFTLNAESLERSNMIADSTQYLIDRSARVLRGMSLLGRLQNYFSEEPTVPMQQQQQQPSALSTSRTVDRPDFTGFICPECHCLLDTANDLLQHYSSHNGKQSAIASSSTATQQQQQQQQPSSSISNEPSALQEQRQRMKAQQDYIDSLMPTLSQLGQVSNLLANSIASQDELLNSVNSKTEQTSDATMAVTRKAAKMTNTSNKKPILLKSVALLHKQSGKYLSVQGSSVILQHTEFHSVSASIIMIVPQDESSSCNSLCTDMGRHALLIAAADTECVNVHCKAQQFKAWEQWQCEINIQQQQQLIDTTSSTTSTTATETTRLIACSGNWNNGGYMIVNSSNGHISIGTTSQQHKATAAAFDVVDTSDLQYSPYAAGGALHQQLHV